jgi:hypothetical protein
MPKSKPGFSSMGESEAIISPDWAIEMMSDGLRDLTSSSEILLRVGRLKGKGASNPDRRGGLLIVTEAAWRLATTARRLFTMV